MSDRDFFSLKDRSFSLYLLVAMVVLIVIVIGLVAVNDYNNTKTMFDRNYQHLQRQTEQNIIATVKLTDESYTLYDNSLNDLMRKGFDAVLAEYERSGETPSRMNLSKVKHELGEQFDVYVINESGIIEFTTFEPELGLDFRAYPDFFNYLTKIRNSEGYFPARIVEEEMGNGNARKYAYMPTPDHCYLLELGLAKTSFPGQRSSLQYKKP